MVTAQSQHNSHSTVTAYSQVLGAARSMVHAWAQSVLKSALLLIFIPREPNRRPTRSPKRWAGSSSSPGQSRSRLPGRRRTRTPTRPQQYRTSHRRRRRRRLGTPRPLCWPRRPRPLHAISWPRWRGRPLVEGFLTCHIATCIVPMLHLCAFAYVPHPRMCKYMFFPHGY